MSELSLGTLSGLAANSYVVDVASGSTLDLSNATGLPASALPAGSILQVVSTTKTDTFSASIGAGSFSSNVTGLEATITPSATTSKFLVMVNVTGSATSNFGLAGGRLVRDGTPIAVGDADGSRSSLTMYSRNTMANANIVLNASTEFLDSPNANSPVTYGFQIWNAGTATATVNLNQSNADTNYASAPRTVSSITVMEVAG